jgi:hypothetical protein
MTPPASADESAELCRCGHESDQHDPMAARYCRATRSGGLQRGCICAAAGTAVLDRYTGRAVRPGQ